MYQFIVSLLVAMALCSAVMAQEAYRSVLAEQLNQYCELLSRPSTVSHHPRIGKSGPRGLPGPAGPSGHVNYTAVSELLERKLAAMKVEQRMGQLDQRTATLEQALAEKKHTSCAHVTGEFSKIKNQTGGVFDIYPGNSGRKLEVYCDLTTDGGGWTVFQRRMDGSVNFVRNWSDYVSGFGTREGEFWLGLENIHRLLQYGDHELRIDFEDWNANQVVAIYTIFSVDDASQRYRLTVGGYHGTAGDSLAHHNGQPFYTYDEDTSNNCALNHKAGWWYKSCHYSNLNGKYMAEDPYANSGYGYGIEWYHHWNSYYHSMKFTEMKFRLKL